MHPDSLGRWLVAEELSGGQQLRRGEGPFLRQIPADVQNGAADNEGLFLFQVGGFCGGG